MVLNGRMMSEFERTKNEIVISIIWVTLVIFLEVLKKVMKKMI
jgi:hypothetical protein